MYPTKNMNDYMSEMNRLFSRPMDNDIFPSPNKSTASHSSPFRQSTPINRSSSSADSTSPESFPDFTTHRIEERPYESSYFIRRQRPIIGRKIFDNIEQPSPKLEPRKPTFHDVDFQNTFRQTDEQLLFSKLPQSIHEQRKSQNFYELFPSDNKGKEFRPTFAQSQSPIPNNYGLGNSPNFTTPMSSISPNSQTFVQPRLPTSPFKIPNMQILAGSSRFNDMNSAKMCTFCRKNGETPLVYMNHTVKEKVGNQNIVTCPILRSHVCSTCGASGDNAHTITYCPVLRSTNNGERLPSTTITLKNTRIKSNGRRRY